MAEELARTFIAVEVPGAIKDIASSIQNELRRYRCKVSWTRNAGMHLTLKFLGDTPVNLLDEIGFALDEMAGKYSPLEIRLSETGVFGGRTPRVLWLGFEDSSRLKSVQKQVDETLSKLGFQPEKRKFHPHLTLGRIKDSDGAGKMVEFLKSFPVERMTFTAEEIILFRSELIPTGAVYTPLKKAKFSAI